MTEFENPCLTNPPGNYPHYKCDFFHQCVGADQHYEQQCGVSTLYDAINDRCEYPETIPNGGLQCTVYPAWYG